jgi:hypothetical protein
MNDIASMRNSVFGSWRGTSPGFPFVAGELSTVALEDLLRVGKE